MVRDGHAEIVHALADPPPPSWWIFLDGAHCFDSSSGRAGATARRTQKPTAAAAKQTRLTRSAVVSPRPGAATHRIGPSRGRLTTSHRAERMATPSSHGTRRGVEHTMTVAARSSTSTTPAKTTEAL